MPRAQVAVSSRAVLCRLLPPAPLAALLAIVGVVGMCWALTLPPFQSPDEFDHYAYVESLATSFRLPGSAHAKIYSSDESVAATVVNAPHTAFHPAAVPPSWSRADYRRYLASHTRGIATRSNGGGLTSASGNPPLYYLIAAAGYLLDGGGTAYGRLYAVRIEGIVFLLLTTVGAWLLAGETFGRRRLPQLMAAATAALVPMSAFISTSVNPDALIITEWTFALLLMARTVNRRARIVDVAALCALLAAAILTKDTSYALVPPAALAIGLGVVRRPASERLRALSGIGASALITAIPIGVWLTQSRSLGGTPVSAVGTAGRPFSVRQFLSYLWQFYLPRLPFMRPYRLVAGLPVNTVWIDEGTGDFGWLVVSVPDWMLAVARILLIVLTANSLWVFRRMRGLRRLGLLAVDLLALVSLLVLLHVTEYRQTLGGGGAFLQGRYILPVVSLLGLAVGLLFGRLPRAARPAAAAIGLVGLLVAQVLSLTAVLHAYYL
jgi:hypothetical protein